MRKETWIGKKGMRYWYYKYRDSEYFSLGIMFSVVLACIFLIFQVIVPQVNSWFSIRDETIATSQRIAILQENINYMNNLDKGLLQSQLNTATNALPTVKDFGSILDIVADASVASGVSLNDYSFQVGDVASSSGGLDIDTKRKGLTSIKITVVAAGTIEKVKRFIQTLEKSLPVSEVVDIDGSGETLSISIQFYQKSVPDIKLEEDKPLTSLSAEQSNLLQQLAAWRKARPLQSTPASSGAMPLF